ncbi:hypothetical protein [Pseudomonas sp.]|uniref:hypothetical protein n=1 Tax=Pseudomonas sp. TaxID=306 RepID=UPI0032642719
MPFFPCFLSAVFVVRNQSASIENILSDAVAIIADIVSDYELIVVDNASDDDSILVLKRLTAENGLANLQVYALTKEGRSQGASATPDVRCCHVYPIQTLEYRGTRHHYGDAISTTDTASYCRFASVLSG